jgi:hypothetical protein
MKWLRRTFFYTGTGFLLMSVLTELGIYAENVRIRRKAETLLSTVRRLRVGEATLSSTASIRTDFGARKLIVAPVSGSPPEQRYQIIVSDFSLNNSKLKFPSLWRFGLRPSAVEVELRYQDEKLTSFSYLLHTALLTSLGQPTELVAGTAVGGGGGIEQHRSSTVVYDRRPSSLIPRANEVRFGSLLTSGATQEERDVAFHFALSCISSFHGCQSFCQMMPLVWREALQKNETKEISLPQYVIESCV